MPLSRFNPRRAMRLAAWFGLVCLVATSGYGWRTDHTPFLLAPAAAQAFLPVNAAPAAAFQPLGVTQQTRRLDQQLEALAADESWSEMLDLLEGIAAEGDGLVREETTEDEPAAFENPAEHSRYTPLSEWRQRRLATLPEPCREAWIDRVESIARRRAEKAIGRLDEKELIRIADEFFGVPSASEALLAASELAMERGDHTAARRRLGKLHPLLSDPLGRPAGVAMASISPTAGPAALAEAWRADARPADLLVAPLDETLLPIALARLALVSVREGDLTRAATETRLLRALAPEAVGRIAGRDQPLADALDALVASRDPEPTPAGYGQLSGVWATPLSLGAAAPNPFHQRFARRGVFAPPAQLRQQAERLALATRPALEAVAVGDDVFCLERRQLKRIDLLTGQSTPFQLPGLELPEDEEKATARQTANPARPADPGAVIQNRGGKIIINGQEVPLNGGRQVLRVGPNGVVQPAQPARATAVVTSLAEADGLLLAHVAEPSRRTVASRPGQFAIQPGKAVLLAVDPGKPQQPAFRLEPPTAEGGAPWTFDSAVAKRGDRLYITVVRSGVRGRIGLACYDTRTSRMVWLAELASRPQARSFGPAISAKGDSAIVLSGDGVYLLVGQGVATLDAASGAIRWVVSAPAGQAPAATATSASRLIVESDRVLAAPKGSDRLYAWDAATGRPLWEVPRDPEAAIAGVAPGEERPVVVLAGRRVTAFDTLTGARLFAWPDSEHAGLRGMGPAVVRGDEVFWPTRDAIYPLKASTGQMTRPPVGLGSAGASLLATDHGLLVAEKDRLRLLADLDAAKPVEPAGGVSRRTGADRRAQVTQLVNP